MILYLPVNNHTGYSGTGFGVYWSMQRAMQLFLGRPGPRQPRVEDDSYSLTTIEFQDKAKRQLVSQLAVQGDWQGGVLFGTVEKDHLTVSLVAPQGPPGTHRPLLMPSLPYLVGWSEAVAAMHGDTVDWWGNWIAAPNSGLPDERLDLTWLARGVQQGLFDEQHVLVVVGILNGGLTCRAYRWEEGQPMAVDFGLGHKTG